LDRPPADRVEVEVEEEYVPVDDNPERDAGWIR
jgi:hypothetical protein